MTDGNNSLLWWAWVGLATIGGAITSISFRPYKEMGKWEIAIAFVVAVSFSVASGPLVAEVISHWLYGQAPISLHVYGFTMWIMGAASQVVIPVLFARARRLAANAGPQKTDSTS